MGQKSSGNSLCLRDLLECALKGEIKIVVNEAKLNEKAAKLERRSL